MTTSANTKKSQRFPTQVFLRTRLRGLLGQRGQHGSMQVETAVVLPIFLMLFLGFCEYSFACISYMSATYAVRVGARYASLHSLSSDAPVQVSDIQRVVQSYLFIPGGTYSSGNILVYYGNRSGTATGVGNYQGDLVGVGFFWAQNINIPFLPSKSFYISSQSYRVIQR